MPIKHDWEFLQCQNKKLQITRKMSKKKINKPRKCDGGAKEEEEEDGTESRKATN